MASPDQYIRIQTAVSIAISVAISLALFVLFFGFEGPVRVGGLGGYAFDFVPQAFIAALFCSLAPGMATRAKLRRGRLSPIAGAPPRPASLLLRSLMFALLAVAVGAGLVNLLLIATGVEMIDWGVGLTGKLLFGSAVAALITPIALRRTLQEPAARVG